MTSRFTTVLLPLLFLSSACGVSKGSGAGGGSVTVTFAGNLDAREPVREDAFLLDDPGRSSQLAAVVQVRSEDSGRYPLAFYFRKEEASLFAFYVMAESEPEPPQEESPLGNDAAAAMIVGQGTLRFDTDGGLLSVVPEGPLEVHFRGTPRSQTIALDFGSAKHAGGDGLSGFTQYALPTTITYQASQ